MQCTEARQALAKHGKVDLHATPRDLREHLADCADCRSLAADLQYRALFGDLPVPGPGSAYADRALAEAWAVSAGRKAAAPGRATSAGWAMAAAAVLVLGIGVSQLVKGPVSEPASGSGSVSSPVVAVAPNAVRQVDLMMVSARALPEATITLLMDRNVELAGYPGRTSLTWDAALAAGNNQLTLPVQVTGADGGSITVAVESGGARKEMMFTVQQGEGQGLALLAI